VCQWLCRRSCHHHPYSATCGRCGGCPFESAGGDHESPGRTGKYHDRLLRKRFLSSDGVAQSSLHLDPDRTTCPRTPTRVRMRAERVEACLRQLAALCVDLASCPQPQSSRLATSEPIRIIRGCLGSTFFVAPMTRSMSAALVILNRACSSMRLVVSTHSRRVVDRLRSLGLKNVSTLRTRTCLNTRSRDGGEKESSR
jgi:hypothetical protein